MATFRNNKKKDWFPHETEIVFVHGDVCKDGPRYSFTSEMESFTRIGNDRVYDQWTVVFVCCNGNSIIFTDKIKI